MAKPRVCILQADGTNCDQELFYAYQKYGAAPEFVHVNELRNKSHLPKATRSKLNTFQILAIPGGFSYGDDIFSGKILAVELISFLKDQLQEFLAKEGLLLGVCNGFQVLVRTGLLPFNHLGKMDAVLAQNPHGHLECRWVKIKTEKSKCLFIPGGTECDIAVNHGEGNFSSTPDVIKKVEADDLVVFRYIDEKGRPTMAYPANPNGSTNAIAGVCDPTGRILGLMPHPEKFIEKTQHPNWRRPDFQNKQAGFIIENMVKFAQQS